MFVERVRERDNHEKNNGSHTKPTNMTAPKTVDNEGPENNEKDGWKKVTRKTAVSQKPISSTAVPATRLATNEMDCTNVKEIDRSTKIGKPDGSENTMQE